MSVDRQLQAATWRPPVRRSSWTCPDACRYFDFMQPPFASLGPRRPFCIREPVPEREDYAELSELNDYGDRLIQRDRSELLCFELDPGADNGDQVQLVDVKRSLAEARAWLVATD